MFSSLIYRLHKANVNTVTAEGKIILSVTLYGLTRETVVTYMLFRSVELEVKVSGSAVVGVFLDNITLKHSWLVTILPV